MLIVFLYLAAAVAANLVIATLGPVATVPVAFVLIGLNISARDRLHDTWHHDGLRWKMAALIGAGALLSWLANPTAGRIALASAASFALSESTDALIYTRLFQKHWAVRSNGSNLASALVDSVAFPTLAFGAFFPWIIAGQFLAKFFGGAIWSYFLRPRTIVLVALLFACASALQAQTVSVGVGRVKVENVPAQAMAELFTATPPVAGFRANAVSSWSRGSFKPTVLTKLARPVFVRGVMLAPEVGADWLAFRNYRPEPMVDLYASAPLPIRRLRLAGAISAEPWQAWSWTAMAKVDCTLWFRR